MRPPEMIKEDLEAIADIYQDAVFDNRGMMGALIGLLDKLCGTTENRHALFGYLFGVQSSKEMTGAQWIALSRWVDMAQVEDKWLPKEDLKFEVAAILELLSGVKKLPKEVYRFD